MYACIHVCVTRLLHYDLRGRKKEREVQVLKDKRTYSVERCLIGVAQVPVDTREGETRYSTRGRKREGGRVKSTREREREREREHTRLTGV